MTTDSPRRVAFGSRRKQLRQAREFLPKTPEGRIDKGRIRQMFLESKCFDWASFCEVMSWDYNSSRTYLPVRVWVEEKRQEETRRQTEVLSGAFYQQRQMYQREVIKTLKEYPATVEAGRALIHRMISDIHELSKIVENPPGPGADMSDKKRWLRAKKQYDKLMSPQSLMFIQNAIKTAVEAKKSILLLDRYTVKDTEDHIEKNQSALEVQGSQSSESSAPSAKEFVIELVGQEPISGKDLTRLLASYYDKPAAKESQEGEADVAQAGDVSASGDS